MDILEPRRTIHDVLSGNVRMKSAIENKYGVDVIAGSYIYDKKLNYLKLRDKINSIKDDYDFVVVDSSPSLNDELLATILSSDNLFVVSTPDYPTLSCSFKAAKLASQRGKPITGMIINKIRQPKFELSLKDMEDSLGFPVLAKIPDDKNNTGSLFMRIPMTIYKPYSAFSKEINNFSQALVYKKENKGFFEKVLGLNFKREEVNRQMFKEDFYKSLFNKWFTIL